VKNLILLLGSNVGNRALNLEKARNLISFRIGKIEKESKIFETAPWGNTNQPSFYNQCITIHCAISPLEVLRICKKIEEIVGRIETEKWGPRIIDIDILAYGDIVLELSDLSIPHPHLQDRRFALEPMNTLAPDWIHPLLKKNTSELLNECKDDQSVLPIH
jgi:2-amino-4-hydroxy-6-hydroxymethyldihydropteridine diphosphokinase